RHLDRLRGRLSQAMENTIAKLKPLGIEPWLTPKAGLFLWCKLPEGIDAASVARRALAENVVLAPGNAFSLSQSASGFLRFNAAQSEEERIFRVLEKAMQA